MKIAIVGMGVAGSYLSSRLSDENAVTGFDMLKKDKFDAVCGWGTTKEGMKDFAKNCGLNFEDYVIHTGNTMTVDVKSEIIRIDLKGLCCFDKVQFIKDMAEGQDIKYDNFISKKNLKDDYDVIIDSTGLIRSLLPRIQNDFLIPCIQYKVKYQNPPFDDFYIKSLHNLSGYMWYFPLGNGIYHVGAGDYFGKQNEELASFFNKYPCEIIKKSGRPVRITPPSLCEPFYSGKVVGVGESIGTVYPMLGEGIIPSLQCSDLLIENLHNLSIYRSQVLDFFKIFNLPYEVIKSKISGNFSLIKQSPRLWRIYQYMKKREDRYGMHIRMNNLVKIVIGA